MKINTHILGLLVVVGLFSLQSCDDESYDIEGSNQNYVYIYFSTSSASGSTVSTTWISLSTALSTFSNSPHPTAARIADRKSTRLNSSHIQKSRMPSSA